MGKVATNEKHPQKYFIEYMSKYKSHRVGMRRVFVLTVMVNISRSGVKETRLGRVLLGVLGRVDKRDSHMTRSVMQGRKLGARLGSRPHRRYLVGIDSAVSVGFCHELVCD